MINGQLVEVEISTQGSAATASVFLAAPPSWAASTAYVIGDHVSLTGGEVLECTADGTTGATEPAAAGVDEPVVDGTVTWQQIDAIIGGQSIPVDNLNDFSDEGGQVEVAGVLYDYTTVLPDEVADDGSGTVELATALTADVAESDPVLVRVGDEVGTDAWAVITLGDDEGDTVRVPIDYKARPMFPEGVFDPPVTVRISDDLAAILDAPGRPPAMEIIVGRGSRRIEIGAEDAPGNNADTIDRGYIEFYSPEIGDGLNVSRIQSANQGGIQILSGAMPEENPNRQSHLMAIPARPNEGSSVTDFTAALIYGEQVLIQGSGGRITIERAHSTGEQIFEITTGTADPGGTVHIRNGGDPTGGNLHVEGNLIVDGDGGGGGSNIQTGEASVTGIPAGGTADVTVFFPVPFSAPPHVPAPCPNWWGVSVSTAGMITETEVTFRFFSARTTNIGGTVTASWIAVGAP